MSRRVLVVENETDIQEVLCSILELADCDVEIAADGAVALEKLATTTEAMAPDLIFLDLMMPEMDGATFVHEMRQRALYPSTPIIVISGDIQVREQVRDLDMDVFISKPFSVNEVLDVVAALIGEPLQM
jgi:CheY-like chemotaxis protein